MTSRTKDIVLACSYILGIQLLYWPIVHYSTVRTDLGSVALLFGYWALIFPAYFVARGFSKEKWIFWGVALGGHVLASVLSQWSITALIEQDLITGWDDFNYVISWACAVFLTSAALFVDLIILAIKTLVNKRKKASVTERPESPDENETHRKWE